MDKRPSSRWLPAELVIMKKWAMQAKVAEGGHNVILDELEEIVGFRRTLASVRNKLSRMRSRVGTVNLGISLNLGSYPIHENLKLFDNPNRGGYALYTLMCNNGHIIEKEPCNWTKGCSICSGNFIGGIPKNDFRPAVVYLIYIKYLKAVKIGYATGEGKEAIIKRFTRWKMPYEYEILGYDQSTRTEAAEHEQWLLNNTLDYDYFSECQDFSGWTEFRHQSIVKDLLPEYETVLDTAFRI